MRVRDYIYWKEQQHRLDKYIKEKAKRETEIKSLEENVCYARIKHEEYPKVFTDEQIANLENDLAIKKSEYEKFLDSEITSKQAEKLILVVIQDTEEKKNAPLLDYINAMGYSLLNTEVNSDTHTIKFEVIATEMAKPLPLWFHCIKRETINV